MMLNRARLYALERAIEGRANYFAQIVYDSLRRSRSGTDPGLLMISTKQRKVYVGPVTRAPDLRPGDEGIHLLPVISDYRDETDLEMKFTVFYPYTQYGEQLNPADFVVVIPQSEVTSIRRFDGDFYVKHFAKDEPAAQ